MASYDANVNDLPLDVDLARHSWRHATRAGWKGMADGSDWM